MKIGTFTGILLAILIVVKSKKEAEVTDDFTAEVDYRNEKSNSTWRKRGTISFVQKNAGKNYKQSINVNNEEYSLEQIEEIKSECRNGNGLYYIRVKTGSNFFFSSIKSCELVRNEFKDRFIINHFGPIKRETIMSINYDVDNKYTSNKEGKRNGFRSEVDLVDNIQAIGPIFPEEKPEAKGQPAEQQSFFSKYWWMIMMVLIFVMTRGSGQEEGAPAAE